MPIAILDPFSGISGDMALGALVDVGLDSGWLEQLPARLGLDGVTVKIQRVRRAGIDCAKVDFAIPPQPHGRHIAEIQAIVARSDAPTAVRAKAEAAFMAIATVEGQIHGVPADRVHLHEVGAVDAILDVLGAIWGFDQLGVHAVYCGPIALGDGTVKAAHGVLPVPAPATLRLLEGHPVRTGPEGSGELVTPTGAALVRVLSSGPPPAEYIPRRSGFGAGTKELAGRANALRLIIADVATSEHGTENLVQLAADVDDMDAEYLAGAAEALRAAGALDVVLVPTIMKKGRPGTRIEVLASRAQAPMLEDMLLNETTSIGVRRTTVERRSLVREVRTVTVFGHDVRVKVVTLPGGGRRVKPEYDDVIRVAGATRKSVRDVLSAARDVAERLPLEGVLLHRNHFMERGR